MTPPRGRQYVFFAPDSGHDGNTFVLEWWTASDGSVSGIEAGFDRRGDRWQPVTPAWEWLGNQHGNVLTIASSDKLAPVLPVRATITGGRMVLDHRINAEPLVFTALTPGSPVPQASHTYLSNDQ